jgi:hypothetical protein
MRDKREKKNNRLNFSSDLGVEIPSNKRLQGMLQPDYERLLKLWKDKRATNRFRNSTESGDHWRDQFVSRLKKENSEWRELILSQAGARKDDVRELLAEAGGDPLAFLDLLGIPPRVILNRLVFLQSRITRKSDIAKALPARAWSFVKSDYLLFEKVARIISSYERIFEAVLEDTSLPNRTIENLEDVAQFLRDLKRTDILGFQVARTGTPPKEEYRRTIGTLVEICRRTLTKRLGKRATKITLAAVTAILKCAFPGMFKGKNPDERFKGKNPLRLVKDADRLWRQDHAGELLIAPLINHGRNTIEILVSRIGRPQSERQDRRKSTRGLTLGLDGHIKEEPISRATLVKLRNSITNELARKHTPKQSNAK